MITRDCCWGALFVIFAVACDAPPPMAPSAGASAVLAAHDPATHGVQNVVLPQTLQAYTDVTEGSAASRGGSVHLSVTTNGSIPHVADGFIGSVAVFGYAWADLQTGAALVSVIHPVIGRDSHQNPDAWHTHPVQLAAGTAVSTFCIASIGGSQAGISIKGASMQLSVPAQWLAVQAEDLDVVVAFIVQGDAGCTTTGLGVSVLAATAL